MNNASRSVPAELKSVNQEKENQAKRPRLKVVCVCRGGNVRSVAMKMIVNRYLDHSTLACGLDTNDEETRNFLFVWADVIVVMHHDMFASIPPFFFAKTFIFHVGNDVWGNPFDEELQLAIVDLLNGNPIPLNFGRRINPAKVIKRLRDYREKIATRNREDTSV
jgi:hypothetical protein